MSAETVAIEAGVRKQYWEDMKTLYGRKGVADVCLDLQAGFGIDIVFLLFMRLLDHRGISLTEAECLGVQDAIAAWHEHVVVPLRTVRQWMKPRAQTPAIATHRNRIKDAELEAERIELDHLVQWLGVGKPSFESARTAGNARAVLLRGGVDRGRTERFLKLTE